MPDACGERLITCFQRVFPDLKVDQIPAASHDSVPLWDSIAQINLLSLISEEFGIDIDFEEFEGATSFLAIQEVICSKVGGE